MSSMVGWPAQLSRRQAIHTPRRQVFEKADHGYQRTTTHRRVQRTRGYHILSFHSKQRIKRSFGAFFLASSFTRDTNNKSNRRAFPREGSGCSGLWDFTSLRMGLFGEISGCGGCRLDRHKTKKRKKFHAHNGRLSFAPHLEGSELRSMGGPSRSLWPCTSSWAAGNRSCSVLLCS